MSEPLWKQLVPQDELEAQYRAMQGKPISTLKVACALARFAEAHERTSALRAAVARAKGES